MLKRLLNSKKEAERIRLGRRERTDANARVKSYH